MCFEPRLNLLLFGGANECPLSDKLVCGQANSTGTDPVELRTYRAGALRMGFRCPVRNSCARKRLHVKRNYSPPAGLMTDEEIFRGISS